MSRSILDLSSPEVAALIRRSPTAVISLGSVEQHGPHLPCGTDTFAAELIAREVAEILDALLVPFGPYGVTPIHAGHPGTIDLRRSTFEALLGDISSQLVTMGVLRLVMVNWHEGNNASLDAIATETQHRHPEVAVVTAHACYVAQAIYADQGGELTHGGGIEALAVRAHDEDLVHLDRAGEAVRSERGAALDAFRRAPDVHCYITDVTEIDSDGWYGDPMWATTVDADEFARTVAEAVVDRVRPILDARDR